MRTHTTHTAQPVYLYPWVDIPAFCPLVTAPSAQHNTTQHNATQHNTTQHTTTAQRSCAVLCFVVLSCAPLCHVVLHCVALCCVVLC